MTEYAYRYYNDGKLESEKNSKYDDKGHIIKETLISGSTTKIATYEYLEYDQFGNWPACLKTESSGGKKGAKPVLKAITREIEYY